MFKLITVLVILMVLKGKLTYCVSKGDEGITERPINLKVALLEDKKAVCSKLNIQYYKILYTFETSEPSSNPEDTPLENHLASECIDFIYTFLLEKLAGMYKERKLDTKSVAENERQISEWSRFLMDYAKDFYSKHKNDGQSFYDFLHPLLLGEVSLKDKTHLTMFAKRENIDVRDMLNPKVNRDVKKKLKKLAAESELRNLAIENDGPCILEESLFLIIKSPLEALFKFLKENSHVKSIVLGEQRVLNLYSFSLIHQLCHNIRLMDQNKNL